MIAILPSSFWDDLIPYIKSIISKSNKNIKETSSTIIKETKETKETSSITIKTKDMKIIKAKKWREAVSLFFLLYMIMLNFGDVNWINKPDGGDIGEIFRINQVINYSLFYFELNF